MSFAFGNDRARERLLPSNDRDGDVLYIEDSRKIQENISSLQCLTSFFSHLCSGTKILTAEEEEEQLHGKLQEARTIAAETQELLKHLGEIYGGSAAEKNQRKLMHQKLDLNFRQTLKGLDQVTQSYLFKGKRKKWQEGTLRKEAEISYLTMESVNSSTGAYKHKGDFSGGYDTEDSATASNNASQQLDTHKLDMVDDLADTIMLDRQLLEQRREGFNKIQTDIVGLHEMLQDVAWHVNMQGETIENIEMNLVRADDNITATSDELRTATTRRRRTGIFTVILLLVGLIAIIVILFAFRVIK